MRVHIISDMEGVSGIVKWEQVSGGESLYEEGRKLYTEEINACVRGAKAAGATEIVVMDCHGAGKGWTFNSLIPDQLDPDCEWVVQDEWTEYTEFLEQGCDAALFVGMHARAGTELGVLSHTVSGTNWQNLWFNDVLVGETGINAALCGHFGCPVLLVTGDQAVCAEARDLLGDGVTTVAVKRGSAASARATFRRRRARADPGGRQAGAREPLRGSALGTQDARQRSRCSTRSRATSRSSASATASRSSTRARSSRAPTTGGPPGGSSTSRRARARGGSRALRST
jgi:D-amino peptidase